MLKSRRIFLKIFFSALAVLVLYFSKNLLGFGSDFIEEYSDEFISFDENDFSLFSNFNTIEGSSKIIHSTTEDYKNNRTLFVESFLYSETEIKMMAYVKKHH
jgi:hypothetical protein